MAWNEASEWPSQRITDGDGGMKDARDAVWDSVIAVTRIALAEESESMKEMRSSGYDVSMGTYAENFLHYYFY